MKDGDQKIQYLVGIKLDQTKPLQDFLEGLGSDLDPQRDCAYRSERGTNGLPRAVMGDDAAELHTWITQYLERKKLHPLPDEDPAGWDVNRTRSLLELAVLHFDWRDGRPAGSWWERDGTPWKSVAGQFPDIFAGNDRETEGEGK